MPTEMPSLTRVLAYLEEHGPPPEARPEATTEGLDRPLPAARRRHRRRGQRSPDLTVTSRPAALRRTRTLGCGTRLVSRRHVGGRHPRHARGPLGRDGRRRRRHAVVSADYRKALNGVHHPVLSDDVLAAYLAARAPDRRRSPPHRRGQRRCEPCRRVLPSASATAPAHCPRVSSWSTRCCTPSSRRTPTSSRPPPDRRETGRPLRPGERRPPQPQPRRRRCLVLRRVRVPGNGELPIFRRR